MLRYIEARWYIASVGRWPIESLAHLFLAYPQTQARLSGSQMSETCGIWSCPAEHVKGSINMRAHCIITGTKILLSSSRMWMQRLRISMHRSVESPTRVTTHVRAERVPR